MVRPAAMAGAADDRPAVDARPGHGGRIRVVVAGAVRERRHPLLMARGTDPHPHPHRVHLPARLREQAVPGRRRIHRAREGHRALPGRGRPVCPHLNQPDRLAYRPPSTGCPIGSKPSASRYVSLCTTPTRGQGDDQAVRPALLMASRQHMLPARSQGSRQRLHLRPPPRPTHNASSARDTRHHPPEPSVLASPLSRETGRHRKTTPRMDMGLCGDDAPDRRTPSRRR
jgi:hypothetical protein